MINRNNYTVTKEFIRTIVSVKQVHPDSADRYWSYVKHLVLWANENWLGDAHKIEPTFQTYILAADDPRHAIFAPVTIKKIFQIARRFFTWAKMTHSTEFRLITPAWIDSLYPPRRVLQSANETHLDEDDFVSLEDVKSLLAVPATADQLVRRRDQAAAAMLLLSGMRPGAFGSLSLQCVDVAKLRIRQWPELGVHTKNSKKATIFLLHIPGLLEVVQDWDAFVRADLPPNAAWFTPITSRFGVQTLSADQPGAHRNTAVNDRLQILFSEAQVKYRSAHKFRHGHAVYGLLHARTMADYKAVSRNLMHTDITITDSIYAGLLDDEVEQRIAGLTEVVAPMSRDESDLETYIQQLSQERLLRVLKLAAARLAV